MTQKQNIAPCGNVSSSNELGSKPFLIGAFICGIYQIQSKIKQDKIYIGSAINIKKRQILHLHQLRKKIHNNQKIQNHYNKYGENDLKFSILISCERENIIEHEQFFIDSLKPWFNINQKANSCLGRIFSEESKLKLSRSKTGVKKPPFSDEWISNLSKAQKRIGNKPPKQWGNKYGLGRKTSELQKQKVREANIKYKTGKHLSENTKQKISITHKGKSATWNIGLVRSEETRKKISETKRKNKLLKSKKK